MERNLKFKLTWLFTLFFGIIFCFSGCKDKPELATLTTAEVSGITINTAISGGNITSDGGADITARGICYGTTSQPVVTGQHTSDNNGSDNFTSNMTGLTPSTKYYVRAYATNEVGTAYGNEVTFTTTAPSVATLTTLEVTAVTSTTAVSGGNITSDGGSQITARGVCWAATANPTTTNSKTADGSGIGNFASDISGLQPGTTYHVRAYAINSVGTSYGNDVSFTTSPVVPTVTTTSVSSVTRTSAISGGNVTNTGGATVTARGVCWSTTTGPVATGLHTTEGSGPGIFTSNITGLSPNTTYYFRAYATNSAGTAYGIENHFTTNPVTLPEVSTSSVTSVGLTTAVSGGNVIADNGGQVIERGICWNISGLPTTADSKVQNGTGIGEFTVNISGLVAGTVFYLRAYAINSAGTAYGNQMVFSTDVSDTDGNIYNTVLIGSQLWTQSDLKTTRFRDNSPIPYVTDNTEWSTILTPAYCWYNNDPTFGNTYGILYNWYAVETGLLCPTGWHVPSDNEFMVMEAFLGIPPAELDTWGYRGTDEGTKIKSTSGWSGSGNGTNTSGFTALPGGYRYGLDGSYYSMGLWTYWWTSTMHDADRGWYRRVNYDDTRIYKASTSKRGGKFIRCIKN